MAQKQERKSKSAKTKAQITLGARLDHGNVTIAELSELSGRCRASIYTDIKAGILQTIKLGKAHNASVFVRGPVARKYIGGELHGDGAPENSNRQG